MRLANSNILLFNMHKSFSFVPALRTYCDQNKLLKRIPPIGGIFYWMEYFPKIVFYLKIIQQNFPRNHRCGWHWDC